MDSLQILEHGILHLLKGGLSTLQILGSTSSEPFRNKVDNVLLKPIFISDGNEKIEVYVEAEIIDKIIESRNYPLVEFEVLDRNIYRGKSKVPEKLEVLLHINQDIFERQEKIGNPQEVKHFQILTFIQNELEQENKKVQEMEELILLSKKKRLQQLEELEEDLQEQTSKTAPVLYPDYSKGDLGKRSISKSCSKIFHLPEKKRWLRNPEEIKAKVQEVEFLWKKKRQKLQRFTIKNALALKKNSMVEFLIAKVIFIWKGTGKFFKDKSIETDHGYFLQIVDEANNQSTVFMSRDVFSFHKKEIIINQVFEFERLYVRERMFYVEKQEKQERLFSAEANSCLRRIDQDSLKTQNKFVLLKDLHDFDKECRPVLATVLNEENLFQISKQQRKFWPKKITLYEPLSQETIQLRLQNERCKNVFFSSFYVFKGIEVKIYKGQKQFNYTPEFHFTAVEEEGLNEFLIPLYDKKMHALKNPPFQIQVEGIIKDIFLEHPELQTFSLCEKCQRKMVPGMKRSCTEDETQECVEKKHYELKMTLSDEDLFIKVEAFDKAAKKLIIDPETKDEIEAKYWDLLKPAKKQQITENLVGKLIKAKICQWKYEWSHEKVLNVNMLYDFEFL